ncbi:Prenylcysteine oxidase 1 precursor [Oopsacas minuta]|uniref:Prenylcysteine oxidase 1 n=1 Tax=Oopsacas minuta TaxID=111878 RepID=A0AAV7KLJ5_9METZ|nr:Prenylcysteine oxidase 1 precursor [Oopsacas minuta]
MSDPSKITQKQSGFYRILKYIVLLSIVLLLVGSGHQLVTNRRPRIAILGAGMGGTGAAYFLHERLAADIHVFKQKGESIGGRAHVMEVDGREYEAGGSVFHISNHYMMTLSDHFGLRRRSEPDAKVGIYDGSGFSYIDTGWPLLKYFKLMYRYGMKLFFIPSYISSMLDKFTVIYEYQAYGYTFETIPEFLTSLDPFFLNMTEMSTFTFLKNENYPKELTDELITGINRGNYGQDCNLHGFVGMISLCGSLQDSLRSIQGGNKVLAEKMLQESQAILHNTPVTRVRELKEETDIYYVIDTLESDPSLPQDNKFDFVIIAHPLELSGVQFELLRQKVSKPVDREFQVTIATFIQGRINPEFFGLEDLTQVPDAILTTELVNPRVDFSTLQKVIPVDVVNADDVSKYLVHDDNTVWKIWSRKPMLESDLDLMFLSRRTVVSKSWYAYPKYKPGQSFPQIVLEDKLIYINAIEWAASAMEMSLISAKNAALLVEENIRGRSQKLRDKVPGSHVERNEL